MNAAPPLITPARFAATAEVLLGKLWKTDFAEAVAPHRPGAYKGKPLGNSTVYTWLSGKKRIPDWLPGALAIMLRRKAARVAASLVIIEGAIQLAKKGGG